MTWKRFAIGITAIALIMLIAGSLAPKRDAEELAREQESDKPKPYRVEKGVLGKMVSFPSAPKSEPATLTITCDENGKTDGFMVKLDRAPVTPPPLRGVFGEFSFPHEPTSEIELGYGVSKIWMPREGQIGVVGEIVERFTMGERLSFRLAKPNGSGQSVEWLVPDGFDIAKACKS